MITLIVPTRNRAHTLRLVISSYYLQAGISEIIFVSDAGDDETPAVIEAIAKLHPEISTKLIRNEVRKGAAASRNIGVMNAVNENILFCDDDEYLELGYANTCLQKLEAYGAGAVSGRNVYMMDGETPEAAIKRFGSGLRKTKPFNYLIAELVNGAAYEGDITLPFTHSIILTKREYLLRTPFDPHYLRGNGYREESDYQMRLFLDGHLIYVTNDVHSMHLPRSLVTTGGQRTGLWPRIYWSVQHTRYFFSKYYKDYARIVGLKAPRQLALVAFTIFAVYRETLRPSLHRLAMSYLFRARGA
ncbi:glycosyltransferase family 2 protein [Phenylobacterium sp.]|jgi:glycosyltransferase involved in cell wall biosynthesis|uniref:glycosyltransferase family 2 protein n=1 Tax=Phenylobacterium sp. TaxID=1871053 RepID=UPI002F42DF75